VRSLLDAMRVGSHPGIDAVLKRHTFVGLVDSTSFLVQFQTKLLLLDHAELARHMFQQLVLRRFGAMPRLALQTPLPVLDFLRAALREERRHVIVSEACAEYGSGTMAETGGRGEGKDAVEQLESMAGEATALLVSKADMLEEYFRITITTDGMLTGLPELLPNYFPQLEMLPTFLLRLATDTDWEEEQPCFVGIAEGLASFYAYLPEDQTTTGVDTDPDPRGATSPPAASRSGVAAPVLLSATGAELFQTAIYPALRALLHPPRVCARDGTVVQVAALEQLYKVFERC
jgi:DNA mismatch repair protein MLH1